MKYVLTIAAVILMSGCCSNPKPSPPVTQMQLKARVKHFCHSATQSSSSANFAECMSFWGYKVFNE